MKKIKYDGPGSVEEIMAAAGTMGINNSPEGLYVFRDGLMIKFKRGDTAVCWPNGKITREKEEIVQ
jgi:hypothetical protein